MHDNKQTEAEFLASCMLKPLSQYTPEELKEYYEEKDALDRAEEEMLERAMQKDEEYEPEYYGDEDLD